MPIATITSVNLPAHQYPHVEVNINDNTLRRYVSTGTEYGKTLCVFRSPKGPDGIRKVTGIEQFNDLYGNGSVAQYGQPLLNARTLASSNNVTMYCLRATADNAVVANLHIFARFRTRDYYISPADNHTGPDGKTYKAGAIVPGELDVFFVAKTDSQILNVMDLVANEDLYANDIVNKLVTTDVATSADPESYHLAPATVTIDGEEVPYRTIPTIATTTPETEFDDWKEVRLMSIGALGKGKYGNALSFSITSDPNRDKSNNFKNYWIQIYEGSTLIEKFAVTVSSNGIVRNVSKFVPNVVNDDDLTGEASSVIRVDFNEDAVKLLYNEFNQRVNPGYITYDEFDPLLGHDKRKIASRTITTDKTMTGYVICTEGLSMDSDPNGDPYPTTAEGKATYKNDLKRPGYYPTSTVTNAEDGTQDATYYNFSSITGTSLESGNDGDFSLVSNGGKSNSEAEIKAAVDAVYTKIFQGETKDRFAYYNYINTVIFNGILETVTADDKRIADVTTMAVASATNLGITVHYTGETTSEAPIYTNGKYYKCTVSGTETPVYSWVEDTTVKSVTKTRKVKNIKLYFDENNNFLLDLTTRDVDGVALDPMVAPNTANQYTVVSKHGSVIEIPTPSNRVYTSPDTATADYPYTDILSKNKTEIDFFLDANYAYETKMAICSWANNHRSEEFVVYLDAGTSETLVSKVDAYTWVQAFDEATNGNDYKKFWYFSIDAYYGRIKDPYNYKIVEVTSTYNLARHLVQHWRDNAGKHIPYAGSLYAVIDSYLPRSVFPLMDEGLDSEHMDRFIEEHVNYAQVNSRGDVIRATQSTRYPVLGDAFTLSNLTEINNVHIVLDIKKDVEHVCELFSYQFNEMSDLKRFNTILANSVLPKYSAAQVKSISANFTRTSEEAEYGILHLYISVVHKNLVKIVMVDIDVNRNID